MDRVRDEQGGWALMDAVWSAAVVAMAFLATMTLLESSSRSAARSAKSSQALIVAQNEINRMRNVGQRNEANLLAMNETTENVTYRGATFEVNYTAVATAGINEAPVEVCGVDYDPAGENAALPDNAAFIYMRVDVNYLGGPTGATGSTGGAAEPGHATLDSHFAAERSAEVNTAVGMLRVYTLDRDGAPTTVSGVTLTDEDGATKTANASNASKGCYLFTSLAAGSYTIKVNTTLQDVYMTNAGSQVTKSYEMPTGVLRSTALKLSDPVKVEPTYKYRYNSTEKSLSTATAGVNDFVKGAGGTGNWVAMSNEIIKPPVGNPTFFLGPGGMFMPNSYIGNVDVSGNNAVDKAKMYPIGAGYTGFAGPCLANDPGTASWLPVPNVGNATWLPGGTLSPAPVFWLTSLNAKPIMNPVITVRPGDGGTPGPDTDAGWPSEKTEWYYWNQGGSSYDARIQVALVGNKDGVSTETRCHAGYQLGSTAGNGTMWKRIPGSATIRNGDLPEISTALPLGRYEVCARLTFSYTQQAYRVWFDWFTKKKAWQGNPTTQTATLYMKGTAQTLTYQGNPVATTVDFSPPPGAWKAIYSSSASTADTTCGSSTKWT